MTLRYRLRTLLMVTLWISVLLSSLLAIAKTNTRFGLMPWYVNPSGLRIQACLFLCVGSAIGGVVGEIVKRPMAGPIIGVAAAFIIEVICLLGAAFLMKGAA